MFKPSEQGLNMPHVTARRAVVRKENAFTLVEVLIVIAVIALLVGLLLPSLGAARSTGRMASCLSNQRQLVIAWGLYAGDYKDRAMPLAYWEQADIDAVNAVLSTGPSSEQIFWWGTHGSSTTSVDHARGFLSPYLDAELSVKSVFECAEQAWGTYRPQGPSRGVTSTYGYNGYYLSPAKTPGWGSEIGCRPWRRVFEVQRPSEVFVFADTLLPVNVSAGGMNTALLDPPMLWFSGSGWTRNDAPTTAFRHARKNAAGGVRIGSTVGANVDGSAVGHRAEVEWIVCPELGVGSVGAGNGPWYVPDWEDWR
jgi:prepilin-type N-terminal cleavage/methylation domain-containing protein